MFNIKCNIDANFENEKSKHELFRNISFAELSDLFRYMNNLSIDKRYIYMIDPKDIPNYKSIYSSSCCIPDNVYMIPMYYSLRNMYSSMNNYMTIVKKHCQTDKEFHDSILDMIHEKYPNINSLKGPCLFDGNLTSGNYILIDDTTVRFVHLFAPIPYKNYKGKVFLYFDDNNHDRVDVQIVMEVVSDEEYDFCIKQISMLIDMINKIKQKSIVYNNI